MSVQDIISKIKEYDLNGITYINVRDLLPLRPYAKGCNNNIKLLIERKKYQTVINGTIKTGVLVQTVKRSNQSGGAFVQKQEIAHLFDENATEIVVYPQAPPLLEEDDLRFFVDKDDKEHNVLMRGLREKDKIFFKLHDVADVFMMKELANNIQKNHTSYQEGIDYQWFNIDKQYNVLNRNNDKELYLTYSGLMKVINNSRSGIGKDFKEWIDSIVFACAFGSQDDKVKALAPVLDIEEDDLQEFLNSNATPIIGLYLIDIKKQDNDKSVYKFGRSIDMRRRFKNHKITYHKDIKIVRFDNIPEDELAKAENELRSMVAPYRYFGVEHDDELISLTKKELKTIIGFYGILFAKYDARTGKMRGYYESLLKELKHENALLSSECASAVKDVEYKCELAIKTTEHKCELAIKTTEHKYDLAMKDNDILRTKIEMLERMLQMKS